MGADLAAGRADGKRFPHARGPQRPGIFLRHRRFLLLFEKETLLVGGITIGYIRRGAAQSCMIGYWIGERHAAQGHMSAALKLVIPYIFNGLQLHRIEAACIPENFKSIRLLENAGFQREGLLREYLKINGQWRDHMMFSLLADKQSSGGTKYDT